MTELLAAVGSLGTIGGIAAVFTLALWLREAMNDRQHATEDKLVAEQNADAYKVDRDQAVAALASRTVERDAALAQLARTQAALAAADKEHEQHVRETIANAPDPAAAVDRLLAQPLPGAAAHGPAAAGAGDGRPATVPAAGVAGTDPARRDG